MIAWGVDVDAALASLRAQHGDIVRVVGGYGLMPSRRGPLRVWTRAELCRLPYPLCDEMLVLGSPRYHAELDALIYPDTITDDDLAELARDGASLMWIVANRVIDCDYARARMMVRRVQARLRAERIELPRG